MLGPNSIVLFGGSAVLVIVASLRGAKLSYYPARTWVMNSHRQGMNILCLLLSSYDIVGPTPEIFYGACSQFVYFTEAQVQNSCSLNA